MRYLLVYKGGILRSSDEYTLADEAEVKAGTLEIVRFQGDLYHFQTLDPRKLAWKNVEEVKR